MRVVHVLVIDLDYMYLGRFPSTEALQTERRCCQSIYSFVTACGSRLEQFPVKLGQVGEVCLSTVRIFPILAMEEVRELLTEAVRLVSIGKKGFS